MIHHVLHEICPVTPLELQKFCAGYRGVGTHHDDLRCAGRLQQAALLQHASVHSRHMHACCHQVQGSTSSQGRERAGIWLHRGAQALCHICITDVICQRMRMCAHKPLATLCRPPAPVHSEDDMRVRSRTVYVSPRPGACGEWGRYSIPCP